MRMTKNDRFSYGKSEVVVCRDEYLFTIVPLALKRPILTRLFSVTTPTAALPASILFQANGTIFVDRKSCPESQQAFAAMIISAAN